ncbi:MAG: formate dehydrogenase accessory protein FdhE [Negativicutes bacterium]|nr:formate dehydrogenase accessory protein FdhE [Negativicutes bacterium]
MKIAEGIAEILSEFKQAAIKLGPLPADEVFCEAWQKRIAAGEPALTAEDFPMQVAASLLSDAIALWEKKSLTTSVTEALIANYLSDQTVSDAWHEYDILPERGNAYVHLACQTALARTATAVTSALSTAEWTKEHCPVCGAVPMLACIEGENGQRKLVCGACLTRWRYKRIGCTFCKEEQPEQIKILSADELPGWTASLCLTCRGYLKTADLRQMATPNSWQAAILESLPLDYAIANWLADLESTN